jgi:hypothetical protein
VRAKSFWLLIGRSAQSDALPRKAVALQAFMSFFWMSLVAQNHIHHPANMASATQAKVSNQLNIQAKPVKARTSDGTDECPLCQAISQNNAYIAPCLFPLIIVPLAQTSQYRVISSAKWSAFLGHDIKSRAPPWP